MQQRVLERVDILAAIGGGVTPLRLRERAATKRLPSVAPSGIPLAAADCGE